MVPRLVYLTAVAVLIAAGTVLSARGGLQPAPAVVPASCTEVSDAAVAAVVDGSSTRETTETDGVRYGRWLDADGSVLLELRCGRTSLPEVQEHLGRVRAAEAGGDGPTLLGTDPPATLDVVRMGSVIRQVDVDRQLSRTWFVARPLDVDQATALVRASGSGAATPAGDG